MIGLYLGIELGSTRIKAVVIDETYKVVSDGSHTWESRQVNGHWSYGLDEVWEGLGRSLDGVQGLAQVTAMGVSAMMHGYLAFDRDGRLLTPFRTWRNTTTAQAAEELTKLFGFNIPQRWSIAHLYQAILNGEEHVKDIAFVTTLAGYVHWQLTGEKCIGVGDASGLFPVQDGNYHPGYAAAFQKLTGLDIFRLFPAVRKAGQDAGKLRNPVLGGIPLGIPLCPPEGDAGTGMVATNAITPRTGNVSAGTSIFAMVVLEKPLEKLYPEIDMVTTPDGKDVAMVHCNNCCADIDAWVSLFGELSPLPKRELYDLFYEKALEGDPDCGGVGSCNYYVGEPVTGLSDGRPLLVRQPDARFNFPNLARSLVCSALASLAIGMELLHGEGAALDLLNAHGGLYKTPVTGQRLTAAALNVPVATGASAAEGGAWGIALLAAYLSHNDRTLDSFLADIFSVFPSTTETPGEEELRGFRAYTAFYRNILEIERKAAEIL